MYVGGAVCDFDPLSPFQTGAGDQEGRPGWEWVESRFIFGDEA